MQNNVRRTSNGNASDVQRTSDGRLSDVRQTSHRRPTKIFFKQNYHLLIQGGQSPLYNYVLKYKALLVVDVVKLIVSLTGLIV